MRRHEIIEAILIPLLELTGIVGIFFVAYNLRMITDGIPGIQLPIPYISPDQFLPFILSGIIFWGVVFSVGGLYTHTPERPIFDTIRSVIIQASLWFLIYIGFVYLTIGFVFSKEIPRLIIGYVFILSTLYAILLRVCIHIVLSWLYKNRYLKKNTILIIGSKAEAQKILTEKDISNYIYHRAEDIDEIEALIRKKSISRVLLLSSLEDKQKMELIRLCAIYAIPFAYPSILPEVYHITQRNSFIGGMPVIESTALRIGAWGRIVKRFFDIVLSGASLILLSPLFIIIIALIKLEDPTGPAIYKNRRIGSGGREFFLYKFRYMYWKYSVKDAYGIEKKDDEALEFEEELKKKSDMRSGPLYKITHDPRKTKVGKILEKLSLDELPQLWNVLIGNMSLVGPRPHQPREVELYDEHHYQVLSVKPGITGMAQVFGREKNTFEDEIRYDVYYIEHYSLILDFLIIGKTIFVVLSRAIR